MVDANDQLIEPSLRRRVGAQLLKQLDLKNRAAHGSLEISDWLQKKQALAYWLKNCWSHLGNPGPLSVVLGIRSNLSTRMIK